MVQESFWKQIRELDRNYHRIVPSYSNKMEEVNQKMQRYKPGWCEREKRITKHVSMVNPKGDWVCTMCRCRCSELKVAPPVKKYYQNETNNKTT